MVQLADTCLTICCPTFSVGMQTSNQNKNPLRLRQGVFIYINLRK
ncbi:hypothetical protein HMPREF1371_00308 [Enterococcus faecium P1137]|nr:hypothetical protein HMPREF1371_00308 [Enterococcus faecium P1137]